MKAALERVPEQWRPLLIDILGRREPEVLSAMRTKPYLTTDESERGMEALQSEFVDHLRDDDEPTALGKQVDDLVDVFIHCFIMD